MRPPGDQGAIVVGPAVPPGATPGADVGDGGVAWAVAVLAGAVVSGPPVAPLSAVDPGADTGAPV